MTMGIYSIDCDHGSYIGQSTYIEKRWNKHLDDLAFGKHHCAALQKAWRACASSFSFRIVEIVSNSVDLVSAEQWHMNNTPRLLNTRKIAAKSFFIQTEAQYLNEPAFVKRHEFEDVRPTSKKLKAAPIESRPNRLLEPKIMARPRFA